MSQSCCKCHKQGPGSIPSAEPDMETAASEWLRRAAEPRYMAGKPLHGGPEGQQCEAMNMTFIVLKSQDNGRDRPLGCLLGRAAHGESGLVCAAGSTAGRTEPSGPLDIRHGTTGF